MPRILALNGPNLNLLGDREPAYYGKDTLEAIDGRLAEQARAAGFEFSSFQSNAEHELVERVQSAGEDGVAALIINPAAFTHTSVALRDTLAASGLPFIEVHLSNIHAREPFRRQSYFSDLALGVITGFGAKGYEMAMDAIVDRLKKGA